MIKNLIIFGTRPEAIKMAPLVRAFKKENNIFDTRVCVTAQHREMLDQVLDFFEITPDYDLDLMKPNQNLFTLTSDILLRLKPILEEFQPDYVYVHGDTTTTMASSIAAFYTGAKICHVEAGLRTNNKLSPFPEEMNRQVTGRIADYHFAPTEQAKQKDLSKFINFFQMEVGHDVVDSWTPAVSKHFQKFLTSTVSPKTGKPYKATTVNRVLATIRHVGRWLHNQRPLLAGDPLAQVKDLQTDAPDWPPVSG